MKSLLKVLPMLAAALLASCVSVSANAIPAKGSSDDCLVLIRTVVENKTSLANVSSTKRYRFIFSDGLPPKEVSAMAVDYIPVVVKKEGTKALELLAIVDRSMVTGNDARYPLDVELPYTPGAVIVADFSFVRTITEPSSGSLYTNLKFSETTSAQKDETLRLFARDKNAKTWM